MLRDHPSLGTQFASSDPGRAIVDAPCTRTGQETLMRIAVLSDIHGNNWALDAVLRDLDDARVEQVVNLGDCRPFS